MYDTDAFQAESAATNQRYQQALDLLYHLGCQYGIKDAHMRSLCSHTGVYWEDLQNHSIGTPAPVTLAH
jgi:hypothetical protein